ncbi:hypothetical cytosolic protein [Syntrophus aciditrophicus SB]|uniref:Hypothetical cytosolic protein n=1 Tax=Syntrophus aciditrophicus (strain SB) TaxID=56780 RepID=Q2LVI5_SYNAS|nr:hypothetical cytosolic protein [Syntrophus aciditrophicus SB]
MILQANSLVVPEPVIDFIISGDEEMREVIRQLIDHAGCGAELAVYGFRFALTKPFAFFHEPEKAFTHALI